MIFQDKNCTFTYNDSGFTKCELAYKNKIFTGYAFCLETDKDFQSDRTGCFIAEMKAQLKKMRYMRTETRKSQKALIDFKKRLECCKDYDENSFESKRLRKEIYIYQKEIDNITAAITDTENYLKDYIEGKEKLYQKIRAKSIN